MDTNLSQTLGDIQRSLGRIEGNIEGMTEAFKLHVADDNAVEVRVRAVEVAQSKQAGKASVWGIVSNGAAALLGAAAAYWGAKHG